MNKKVLSFFLIGFLIYLFDYSFNENEDENVITIYDDEIQVLIKNWNEQVGRPPREEDIRGIIDQLVEEEILYREAVKLGLDKNDIIVKRRLAQKLMFLRDSLEPITPTTESLVEYYEENQEKYLIEELYTFSQIYFSFSPSSQERAKTSLSESQNGSEPTGGEPFMLGKNFVNRTKKEITRDFGNKFSEALVKLQLGKWHGPIKSSYGDHLVILINSSDSKQLNFEEAKSFVITDFLAEKNKKNQDNYLASLKEKYNVVIESDR